MPSVELKREIYNKKGKVIEKGISYIYDEELNEPVYLNMQFWMERSKYEELNKLCKEYKATNIQHLIQTWLDEEPEKFDILMQPFY